MRSFIAVDASGSGDIARFQSEIISSAGWNPKDVKPVEPPNFHFTLIFLGEISEDDVTQIQSKLYKVNFQPFSLTYKHVGAFPKPESARIIWVGVDEAGGQQLSDLAANVVNAVSDLGFRPDKRFSPHLTIFRVKTSHPINVGAVAKAYDNKTFGTDLIDKFHLKKSELKPSGPVYSNVYTVEAKK